MLRKIVLLLTTASLLMISLSSFAAGQSNFVFATNPSEKELYLNLGVYKDDFGDDRVVFRLCKTSWKKAATQKVLLVNDSICKYVGKKEGYLVSSLNWYVEDAKKTKVVRAITGVLAGVGVAALIAFTGGLAGAGAGALLSSAWWSPYVGIVLGTIGFGFGGLLAGVETGESIMAPSYKDIKVGALPNNSKKKVFVRSLNEFVQKSLTKVLKELDLMDYAF